jgi:formylglycine-generating enzyme required for sulfatase activity
MSGRQFKPLLLLVPGALFWGACLGCDLLNRKLSPTPSPTPDSGAGRSYTETASGLNLEMIWIPGGSFMMGSPVSELGRLSGEVPQHRVELDGYFLAKYEVTQDLWRAVMGTNPSHFGGSGRLPVENVSWNDAMKFCRKLSAMTGKTYTLPTEAQWEYACRAGTTTPFYTGETISNDQANYRNFDTGTRENPRAPVAARTTEVGSFAANPWGLFDMHGNVLEWCLDWYGRDYYRISPARNPTGPARGEGGFSGSYRVVRGGSWSEAASVLAWDVPLALPWALRSATRFGGGEPGHRQNTTGFRPARTP